MGKTKEKERENSTGKTNGSVVYVCAGSKNRERKGRNKKVR